MSANAMQGLMNLINPRNNRMNAAQGLQRLGQPVGQNALVAPAPISIHPVSSNGQPKSWNSQNQNWFTPVTVTAKSVSRNVSRKRANRKVSRKNRKTRSRR